MKITPEVIKNISSIATFLREDWRISNKGVLHIVVKNIGYTKYSICYFKKSRKWRIFYPYPSFDKPQIKITCNNALEVLDYFLNLEQN